MAAFSHQPHPFLLDSVFLPSSTPIKNLSTFIEEGNINNTNFFSQVYFHEPLHETPLDIRFIESSHLDHITKVANFNDTEPSLTPKQSTDSSTVVDNRLESGEQVTQKLTPMDKKKRSINGCSSSSAQSKDPRQGKRKKQNKCSGELKEEEKKTKLAEKKEQKKVPEEPPSGYIHVRARRGQATDSHSLAERVRREKISERMKTLQKLVPGCDKVTGKALMLDEIINYVQSLQNQVEFLSLKLASVNPLFYDFGMDADAFMVRPAERLNSMASPLPSVQQCSPAQTTAFANANTSTATTTTFIPPNDHYNLFDSSTSFLLHGQRPNDFTQNGGSLLWDMEEQRQKFLNPSVFTNNLCSYH